MLQKRFCWIDGDLKTPAPSQSLILMRCAVSCLLTYMFWSYCACVVALQRDGVVCPSNVTLISSSPQTRDVMAPCSASTSTATITLFTMLTAATFHLTSARQYQHTRQPLVTYHESWKTGLASIHYTRTNKPSTTHNQRPPLSSPRCVISYSQQVDVLCGRTLNSSTSMALSHAYCTHRVTNSQRCIAVTLTCYTSVCVVVLLPFLPNTGQIVSCHLSVFVGRF